MLFSARSVIGCRNAVLGGKSQKQRYLELG
jgi:hypothetical protein